jgi:hypothetical protein
MINQYHMALIDNDFGLENLFGNTHVQTCVGVVV